VSAKLQLLRKGHVQIEKSFGDLEAAVATLPGMFIARSFPAGADKATFHPDAPDYCSQPGCPDKAISIYRLKEEFSRSGEEIVMSDLEGYERRRAFCARHLRRGDCGREDSDANYELVSGTGPDSSTMRADDVSQSALHMLDMRDVDLTDPDELGDRLKKGLDEIQKQHNAD
jgi:hypothetical protein